MKPEESFKKLYLLFHEYICPLTECIESLLPESGLRQITNEIRNGNTHIFRYFLDETKGEEIDSAEKHLQRAVLDAFKIVHTSLSNSVASKFIGKSEKLLIEANKKIDSTYNHGVQNNFDQTKQNWVEAIHLLRDALIEVYENVPSTHLEKIDKIGTGFKKVDESFSVDLKIGKTLMSNFGILIKVESKLKVWGSVRLIDQGRFHYEVFQEFIYALLGASEHKFNELVEFRLAKCIKALDEEFKSKNELMNLEDVDGFTNDYERYCNSAYIGSREKIKWEDGLSNKETLSEIEKLPEMHSRQKTILKAAASGENIPSHVSDAIQIILRNLQNGQADRSEVQLSSLKKRNEEELESCKQQLKDCEKDREKVYAHLGKLNIADPRLDCEEKSVTTVFLDIVGFSTIKDRKEAKRKVIELWGLYLVKIEREPPLINNSWGDAIMSIFENADTAVLTTIELMKVAFASEIDITVGISSGSAYVVENNIKNKKDMIGKEINLAARIEQSNKIPNSICICENTYKELSDESKEMFKSNSIKMLKGMDGVSEGEEFNIFRFDHKR